MNAFATLLANRLSSPHGQWLAAVLAALLLWLASGVLIAAQAAEPGSEAPLTLTYSAASVAPGPRHLAAAHGTPFQDRDHPQVGVAWKSRTSRLGFDRGVLGLQLDSGYRMSLRVKRGSFAVYMKGQF